MTTTRPDWQKALADYAKPLSGRAIRQVVNTLVPYLAVFALMVHAELSGWPYGVTLALAVPAALLLVRIFILFHDCCHDSFFASERANRVLGTITGVLTFTPFDDWRYFHRRHHATSGDLDRRGLGDMWMMTVEEYRSAPLVRRIAYRIYRNPLFMLGLGPAYMFLVVQRIPDRRSGRKGMLSILFTDLLIAAVIVTASLTIGFWTWFRIQIPIMLIAGAVGVWLFFVQHQFEGVWWGRGREWSFLRAAVEGSSHYRLPKVLQWFSGNIGLHHIHHARPRVPNYRLEDCLEGVPGIPEPKTITLLTSLRSLRLDLWDEQAGRLVSFRSLRRAPAA